MYLDEFDLSLYYALLKEYDESRIHLMSNKPNIKISFEELRKEAEKQGCVVYGAGVMFEYFINTYTTIQIKYVVDKSVSDDTIKKNGYSIYPINKLKDEKKDVPILITPARYAHEIYNYLEKMKFEKIYVLPEMEYNREEVKKEVKYLSEHPEIQERYLSICRRNWINNQRIASLENKLWSIKQQMESLKRTEAYQYKYILHCNRMISACIDVLPDSSFRHELIVDQMKFRFCTEFGNGYIPDLDDPKTFNEKNLAMQLKEEDNQLFARVSDKYELKSYIAEKIGEKYIVPALGVWNDPKDIEWEKLPDNIIIKATNGGDSESIFVVEKNDEETRRKATEIARKWVMKTNSVYYSGFNGAFRHVKQRIIAERNIEKHSGDLLNYKFWMFHGKAKLYYISKTDLSKEFDKTQITYFDMDGEPFEARTNKYPLLTEYRKTTRFDEMVRLAEILANEFEFVRVDFMETPELLVVSELTLTPDGGLRKFDTRELDYSIGKYW